MRITGGTFRSRTLQAPRGAGTRPTADRVREAVFGMLDAAGAVVDARVLDLYAGTGALGLEALSRGAREAVFVESAAPALRAIRANVAALGLEGRTQVVPVDVSRAARRLPRDGAFDLVLADPPWNLVDSGEAARALEEVVGAGVLADHATVVVEHAARSSPPVLEGLAIADQRRYGDTAIAVYKTVILAMNPTLRPSPSTG